MYVDCNQVLSELVRNISCSEQPVLLDPAKSFSCSGHHVLTQEDVDKGAVSNEVLVGDIRETCGSAIGTTTPCSFPQLDFSLKRR